MSFSRHTSNACPTFHGKKNTEFENHSKSLIKKKHFFQIKNTFDFYHFRREMEKIRRGPKLEGCAFANFGNSSVTEGELSQKRERNGGKKKKNQCCLDRESNPGAVAN